MADDPKHTVDELASDLDDLALTVEELEVDPGTEPGAAELSRLHKALEDAGDAADSLGEELDEESDDSDAH